MIGSHVSITCTKCCQSFMWDLEKGPAHKSKCPYCEGEEELPKPKPKKRKKQKRMLTKAERYPENKDEPKPEYPKTWMLDFHCKSINEYHMSPHLRVSDKGAAYRALEKAEVQKVKRTARRVKVTITSFRQRMVDCQSLYGGSSKGLLDVLVRLGWVHDDTEEWCKLEIVQEQVLQKDIDAGKQRGTLVELKAIPKPKKKE